MCHQDAKPNQNARVLSWKSLQTPSNHINEPSALPTKITIAMNMPRIGTNAQVVQRKLTTSHLYVSIMAIEKERSTRYEDLCYEQDKIPQK